MKLLLVLSTLLLAPDVAHAALDYKCESNRFADQVGGWLRFGSSTEGGSSAQLEYWNGYPPITLLDSNLDGGKAIAPGGVLFTSETDRLNGASAVFTVPGNYLALDKFTAKAELTEKSAANGSTKTTRYELNCVRH
jgi:hypothetical protein